MKTILIVEDEDATQRVFSMALERSGYRVIAAENGHQGLEALALHRPDLVVCDVMMPYLGGVEMCRRMQSDPQFAATPVVFMSAVAPNFAELGCRYSAFLQKPISLEQLLGTVRRVLGDPMP